MPTYIGIMLWFVFWQVIVNAGVERAWPPGRSAFPRVLARVPRPDDRRDHLPLPLLPGAGFARDANRLAAVRRRHLDLRRQRRAIHAGLSHGYAAIRLAGRQRRGRRRDPLQVLRARNAPDALETAVPGWPHGIIATVFIIVAALVGVKGIRYVARVATYLPLIPVIVLLGLLALTAGGLGDFAIEKLYANIPADSKAIDVSRG